MFLETPFNKNHEFQKGVNFRGLEINIEYLGGANLYLKCDPQHPRPMSKYCIPFKDQPHAGVKDAHMSTTHHSPPASW
jgi:hypothetical protein